MAKNSSDKGKSAKKPSSAQNKSASPVGDAFGKAKDWLKAHNIYSKKFYKKHGKGKSWIAKFATSFVAMLTTVVVVAVVLINVYGARYGLGFFEAVDILAKVMRSNDNVQRNNEELGISNEAEKMYTGVKNIMLYGIDSRTMSEESRSDAIMMLTVDMDNKKIKMTSFARDTYVTIPGYYKDKLNHAFVLGWHKTGNIADGATLSMNTINSNFDMNLTNYVTVNFDSITKIVDSIGGLDLKLSDEEAKIVGVGKGGTHHLDGAQTLTYARIRSTAGGDFTRTLRHRKVLTAMAEKIMQQNPIEMVKTADELTPLVKTSLSSPEILGLGFTAGGGNYDVIQDSYPEDETSKGVILNGIYYLKWNKEDTINKLHKFIFNE